MNFKFLPYLNLKSLKYLVKTRNDYKTKREREFKNISLFPNIAYKESHLPITSNYWSSDLFHLQVKKNKV